METELNYTANITRDSPGCILFVIDTSSSMADPFQTGMSRIAFVTDALNRTLTEVAAACRRFDGTWHYFDIGVLAYGNNAVRPALAGPVSDQPLVSITNLAASARITTRTKKEHDGAGGIIEVQVPFPIYVEVQANGNTPMCTALRQSARIVGDWCGKHRSSFPPIVMHLTDGEATDGSPQNILDAARLITEQRTADGFALLLNLHIAGGGTPIRFPHNIDSVGENPFAAALFQASSVLPPPLLARCFKRGINVQPGSRGYIFNGAMEDVISVFDIGTRAATDRTQLVPSGR